MLENALAAQTQVVDKLQEMVRGLCARLDQGGNNNVKVGIKHNMKMFKRPQHRSL
ncbi:hypothetical protein RchiOBHm_Chr4g0441651 [Rosa chinensis]|uniref:Uncharacterized protein n=1 Tax=Rosa chinensis TaxID=74649 RepID=A0A2P6R3F1_ROSCH|nr:hypothetical protein RchiOBHm_Chr4g0441651 [Rosa chinensis]